MENKMFVSRDIGLVSALVVLGFKIEDTQLEQLGTNARLIAYWSFKDTPEIQEARKQFNAGELRVEPKNLLQTLQSLKSEITGLSREAILGS
jgi:hypothetical protein